MHIIILIIINTTLHIVYIRNYYLSAFLIDFKYLLYLNNELL